MVSYRFQDLKQTIPIGKIICLARTYKEHAREMNAVVTEDPLLFLKPSTSIIYNHGTIIIPRRSHCLHHEVEMGVILGKKGKNIREENAMNHVLGYLVALDITARDIQSGAKKNGWPWTIAKGFDTFAPISDAVGKTKVPNPLNLDLSLTINGVLKQHANTNEMIYSLERIISFISEVMTLEKAISSSQGPPKVSEKSKKETSWKHT